MSAYKEVGRWWNDKGIELIEIQGEVYALYGWNGEIYTNCWKCSGDFNMDASEEKYTLRPIHREVDEDDFEIVGYELC